MSNNGPTSIEPVAKAKFSKNRKGVFSIIFEEIILKNFNDMKETFVQEVLIPQTQDWMFGILSDMLNDMFKSPGSSYGRSGSIFSGRRGRDYTRSFKGSSRRDRRDDDRYSDDIRDWEEISFDNRADAERVISSLKGTLRDYQTVTIGDLFSFSGVNSSWADNKYGWADLDNARAIRGRDGRFYLALPEPRPIDDDQ